ncbi:hypothetical protein FPQ18DRAFT_272893 [Pyronema domesticum]|uniref:Similar to 3-hydroxybenzoate 6-hydroxylase acc. no. Q3S4B7 n=1 Tax=Pyronema omphalodes (strain CBS 100304) TaxID=1076935 RepID=U4L3H1_PYROM|nr:hypothetical protein FPQ18DRAFT_272893 [Pyronema domesticum]CCX06863.1 Similar to 3-hydroxybenzoate 6-hydroxylase; acc. no. Q3S4B7 [Pyronema omphalodes CBS 100304]
MPSPISLDIIIVGAGLGGLAAAISCSLAGHKVRILEQTRTLGEVGAGIQVPPNASRILAKWGLMPQFQKVSVSPGAIRLRRYSDGKVLSEQPFVPDAESDYGAPYCNVHRADYHALLVSKARELGIKIILDARVQEVDFSAPSVTLSNGNQLVADLIIGADGLKSHLRSLLLGRKEAPYLTGDLAYRVLISAEKMRQDPALVDLATKPMFNIWMGPNMHAVCYLLKGGTIYNIVLCCPDNLPTDINIAPAKDGEVEELFTAWDPRLHKLFRLAHGIQKWRLENSREIETWVHQEGKFALLGDACHSTLPYLAQGAAMAVEDGDLLGELLEKIQTKEQVPDVLKIYEYLRKPRTEYVVKSSTSQRDVFHLLDGEEQRNRDRIMLADVVMPGFPNKWRDHGFRNWLFGYDTAKEAEKGWGRYVKEGRFWNSWSANSKGPQAARMRGEFRFSL